MNVLLVMSNGRKTIQWSTKILAALSSVVIMPLPLKLLSFQSLRARSNQELLIVMILVVLWLATIVYNLAIWIVFGRQNGQPRLVKSEKYGERFTPTFLTIGLMICANMLLIIYIDHYKLPIVDDFPQKIVLFTTCISLSILGLKSTCQNFQDNDPNTIVAVFAKFLSTKWATVFALFTLSLIIIFGAYDSGILWQGISGDLSISIYASQSLAAGNGPFQKYIIMHPPMAYIPGAIGIFLGRLAGIADVISVRLVALINIVLSTWLTYLIAYKFIRIRSAAFIAAGALGWQAVLLATTYISPTKTIVMLFSLIMILAIQSKKWVLAGFSAILLLLSWAGAFIYMPIPFLIIFFTTDGHKVRNLLRLLLGIGGALLSIGVYLSITGAVKLFLQQYILGVFQNIVSKVTPTTSAYMDVSAKQLSLFDRLGKLSNIDLICLIVGLIAIGAYLWERFSTNKHWWQQTKRMLGNQTKGPVLLTALALITIILFDFQSFIDAIPLIPILSIFIGWLAAKVLLAQNEIQNTYAKVWQFAYVSLILLGMQTLRFIGPPKTYPVTLQSQTLASGWLATNLAEEETIQVLGNLSPLIFNQLENQTRVVHLGPKTMIAMEAEGSSLTAFTEEILSVLPNYILVDKRNSEQTYLKEFFQALEPSYLHIELPNSRGGHTKFFYRREDERPIIIAYGMKNALNSPNLFLADRHLASKEYEIADTHYRLAPKENRRLLNYCLIRRANIYLLQGKEQRAMDIMKRAATRGKHSVWGNLNLGTYFLEQDETQLALNYFEAALGSQPREGIYLRAPTVFGLSELLAMENLENISLGDSYYILAHEIKPVGQDQALFSLWWWVPGKNVKADKVIISWLDEMDKHIGQDEMFTTIFYPQIGVQWSYLLSVPDVEAALKFQIGIQTEDGNVHLSTTFPFPTDD